MKFIKFITILTLFLVFCVQAGTFKKGVVITDARAQKLVEEIVSKLTESSGRSYKPKIYFIVDPAINAFATDEGQIFMHTGLITSLEKVGQLVGVLAHELGHITGGHHHRMSSEMKGATTASIVGTLLGGLAALAGGGGTALLSGVMLGQAAELGMFARFSQGHEKEADAAAYRMLAAAKISANGLIETFELFKKKSRYSEPPYLRTHPSDQDRIDAIKHFQKQHPFSGSMPERWVSEFESIKAVFFANLYSLQETERKYYGKNDTAATLAKTIILSRRGKYKEAFKKLDLLLEQDPNNPYLYEMYGQFKLQSGDEDSTLKNLEKAIALDPHALSIRLLYAQALFTSKKGNPQEAINHLQRIVADDSDNVMAWLLMVGAHRKLDENDQADLAHAEACLRMQDMGLAKQRAKRAYNSENPKVKKRAKLILDELNSIED